MPEVPAWDEHRGRWQRVVNAREIPPRRAQRDLDPYVRVRVRVVWEHDGEELRETIAVAWAGRDVLVDVTDPRVHVGWVWLDAADVERLVDGD
jgi:hypothetical protein